MNKPIIAFDMDDVLADSTEYWRNEINKRTGLNLTSSHYKIPGEYWNYYEHIWKTHKIDHLISIPDIDLKMKNDQSQIQMYAQSLEVLQKLNKSYVLIVVTSRDNSQQVQSQKWLDINYPEIFDQLVFTGNRKSISYKNKGQICKELGVELLVDDNPGHCMDAIFEGIKTILFGDFGWHLNVPPEAIICKNWAAIADYYGAQ